MKTTGRLVQFLNVAFMVLIASAVMGSCFRVLNLSQDSSYRLGYLFGTISGGALLSLPFMLAFIACGLEDRAAVRRGLRANTILLVLSVIAGLLSAAFGNVPMVFVACFWGLPALINVQRLSA